MMGRKRLRRLIQYGCLSCLLGLLVASSALAAADSVNLTRFSPAVSGTVTGGLGPSGAVTVDLLRNTLDVNGNPVRQQVDSFTAPINPVTGNWLGEFTKHAFSTTSDQVEINYTGTPAQEQVTIGRGVFLPSSSTPGAHRVQLAATSMDGQIGIAGDGSALSASCNDNCSNFTVNVNGDPPMSAPGGNFTFPTHLTNADKVLVTAANTDTATTVNLADSAPLLDPAASDLMTTSITNKPQPACSFYLVTSEVVCFNLTPGSFTIAQQRGASTLATHTVTVPSRPGAAFNYVPTLAAAGFANVAAGDQLKLMIGARVLSTLTVNPLTIHQTSPFGDLRNGSSSSLTGSCISGIYFSSDELQDVCAANGTIPVPSNAAGHNVSLFSSIGSVDNTLGLMDDTSAGSTNLDTPSVAFTSPQSRTGVHTPFNAFALATYNDPAAIVAVDNALSAVGPNPPLASTLSSAPVTFSVSPFGSSSFTALGNANQAHGLALPALTPGPYVDRFTLTDSRGDTNSFESSFVALPAAPSGPAGPKCSVKSTGGLKAVVTASKSKKPKPKPKKKTTTVTLSLSCSSNTTDARVTVWLARGSSILASGTGIVRRGAARITLSGKFVRGTYRLLEVIDAAGQATETTQLLTLKGR